MRIIISNSSDTPIYEQIMNQIKEAILNGELKEGEPLPSIRSLAKELQISVITTKRAYDELEASGFVTTFPGKGSFVAATNKEWIRETRMKQIEEKLAEAATAAKQIGLHWDDLQEMLRLVYEEV